MFKRDELSNKLLDLLPKADFEALSACLEPVALEKGLPVGQTDADCDWVYFPTSGIISIIPISSAGHKVEAGLFGRDGFGPTAMLHGRRRGMHEIVVQVPGEGYRLPAAAFRRLVDAQPELRRLLGLYSLTLSTQVSYTALSNAVHSVAERLARWLLMIHDRSDGDEMAITHHYLSVMLAVRRPSVTTALHMLEGARSIHAERGYVTIRDRGALEDFAADAYGQPEAEYERLLAPLR